MTTSEEALRAAVTNLTAAVDQLRAELVRKDVYESNERARDQQFAVIERDITDLERTVNDHERNRRADRRLVLTGLAFPVAILLLQLWMAAQLGTR